MSLASQIGDLDTLEAYMKGELPPELVLRYESDVFDSDMHIMNWLHAHLNEAYFPAHSRMRVLVGLIATYLTNSPPPPPPPPPSSSAADAAAATVFHPEHKTYFRRLALLICDYVISDEEYKDAQSVMRASGLLQASGDWHRSTPAVDPYVHARLLAKEEAVRQLVKEETARRRRWEAALSG